MASNVAISAVRRKRGEIVERDQRAMLRKVVTAAAFAIVAGPALAHPHVLVAAKAEIIYDGQGNVLGVNHVWTFDEQYSAFATMGFPKDKDGRFEAAKLAELAKVNTESLGEFGYFTEAKAGGRKVEFSAPQNYRLEQNGAALTLFMTLPLKAPAPGKTFSIDVSDPTYFVAFAFDDAKDAVVLARAPQGCSVTVRRPKADDLSNYAKLSDQMFAQLTGKSEVASAFGNKAIVACP
jgi:ABC-type uncharacterized transport system substrate-binding protein